MKQKKKYASQKTNSTTKEVEDLFRQDRIKLDNWVKDAKKVEEAKKVKKVSVKRQGWTKEEIDYLRKNYNVLKTNKIANTLGRTVPSIHSKARAEGLLPSQQKLLTKKSVKNTKTNEPAKNVDKVVNLLYTIEKESKRKELLNNFLVISNWLVTLGQLTLLYLIWIK